MMPPRVVAGGPQQGDFSGSDGAAGGGQQPAVGAQQVGGERFSIFLTLLIFIKISGKGPCFCNYGFG
jgi:hypothetical protein